MAFVVDNSITVAWSVSSQADRYSRRLMLELAQRRGLPLATRDTPLQRAARAAGVTLA